MILEFINNPNQNDIKLSLEDVDKLLKHKYIYHLKYTDNFPTNLKNIKFIIVCIKMNNTVSLEKICKELHKITDFFKNSEITVVTNSNYADIEIDLLIGLNDLNLNSKYTFDNFTVKPSNQFAYSATKTVAKKPAKTYNPLIIYGSSNAEKTHLLKAIESFLQDKLNVIYITSEEFMNGYKKINNCDVLLVDNIHLFENNLKLQRNFYNFINELYTQNKQICLTSNTNPKKLNLIKKLKNIFEKGLIVDLS